MKFSIPSLFLLLLAALPLTAAAAGPEVIYWNSDAGKVLRARIAPDADCWQLIPWFANQEGYKGARLELPTKGVSIAIVFEKCTN